MANIFNLAFDALSVEHETQKDIHEILAGLPVDYDPEAKAVLKFLSDLKVKEPWLTEDVMVKGLEFLGNLFESHHTPPANG